LNIQIKATRIFYRNLEANTRVVANYGGARSSKSYSIMQLLVTKFLTEKNKRFLVLRKTLPSLKISTLVTFKEILNSIGMASRVKGEKITLNYFFNDNLLHFGSLDNFEKIKSSEWNYVFIEEVTEFDYSDYVTLKLRLSAPSGDGKRNQIFLACNPIDENHWIKQRVYDVEKDITWIHSTYKDNPFLSEDYKEMLEDLINQDPNYYRIYVLGEWGRLENLIYHNYSIIPDVDVTKFSKDVCYGMDFGYNSPSALLKVVRDREKPHLLYLIPKIYAVRKTTPEIIELMKKTNLKKTEPIFADSSEPDRLKEIRKAGYNIKPALKDVASGIEAVKQFHLLIPEYATDLIREIRLYSWKTDPKTGDPIDEPIKSNDHYMDTLRYAVYNYFRKKKRVRVRWI